MTTIAQRGRAPNVMFIEDNIGDSILVRMAFGKSRYKPRITVAGSAEIGLSMLRREDEYRDVARPDVIILDLNLPYMAGLSLLRDLKRDRELAPIPVVIFSSSIAEADVAAGYAAGASGYFTKSARWEDYDSFVAAVETYWFELAQTPLTNTIPACPV
jgi:CheY-like chemotaxis protein